MKPTFVDNQDGNTLSSAIKAHLKELRQNGQTPEELCIATAYFNPAGLQSISKEATHVTKIKLLIGAEPTPEPLRRRREPGDPKEPEFTNRELRARLDQMIKGLKNDRDYLAFDLETNRAVQDLLTFLSDDKIEVRRYEGHFLHAKAFIFKGGERGLVSGSSNLTYAGMVRNLELNLGHYEDPLVQKVESWFDDLWERSEPYDLAAIYNEMLYEIDPYMIYLRVLFELYADDLSLERDETGEIPVTTFQKHGSVRAQRILDKYGGVLIADGVGLGKTFTSGDIIQRYRDNRQRVLLICPAALRDTEWKKFLNDHQLLVERVSYEQLSNDEQLGGSSYHLQNPINDYSLIVIDEGHNYRNPDAKRSGVLRNLLSGKRRDVVFLSATPVNNSLWDLYHILGFFLKHDATLSDLGIRSIRSRFNQAMGEDPFNLNPDLLYQVIDATTVKRTRKFVTSHYQNDTIPGPDGKPVPIRFPKPHAITIKYQLEEILPGFFENFAEILMPEIGPPQLKMARYKPEMYPKGKDPQTDDSPVVGLLRSIMLKRFESSAYAFVNTIGKMIKQHEAFLSALDDGKVIIKEFFKEWAASDQEDFEQLLRISEHTESIDAYNLEALKRDVENDLEILKGFHADVKKIDHGNSPKLDALIKEIIAIEKDAEKSGLDREDIDQKRKILIFSFYEDTVDWIEEHLVKAIKKDKRLHSYKKRLASVSGKQSRNGIKKIDAIHGFAPLSTKAPAILDKDKFDILISTDVLAEGMNLQQCGNVINFDLPWNPMKLVQRHGRIDRIGSNYKDVYMRSFFPDDKLDALLKLENRIRAKLAQAAASVGVEDSPIEFGSHREATFSDTDDEIKKLYKGDASIYEEGGTKGAAQTGEEYRQELRKAIKKYGDELAEMPWKIGSGMRTADVDGVFFCAKVGKRTYLRIVPTNQEEEIIREIGTCLRLLECTEETDRLFKDDDYMQAVTAWEAARDSIYDDWSFEVDPANLQPKIPKPNRDAAELVRSTPPSEIEEKQLGRYLDILESPWPRRESNRLRMTMRSEDTEKSEVVSSILKLIDQIGIEPSPTQEPLPPIEKDDIHLISWMVFHKN